MEVPSPPSIYFLTTGVCLLLGKGSPAAPDVEGLAKPSVRDGSDVENPRGPEEQANLHADWVSLKESE